MKHNETFDRICRLLEAAQIEFKVFEHFACRTSQESAAARRSAGAPEAIGAKAILCRMEFSNGGIENDVLVLPGPARINSQALKLELPNLKRFRFATAEEMEALCHLSPGAMPPFAQPIFPMLSNLYVDKSLLNYSMIGFNAGSHKQSMVLRTEDYIRAAFPAAIVDFCTPCSFSTT